MYLFYRRNLDYLEVLDKLKEKGIAIRVASPKLVMEEAPESYKDVTDVVDTCKCKYTLIRHRFFDKVRVILWIV